MLPIYWKWWILSARLKPLLVGIGPLVLGISFSFSIWENFSFLLNGILLFCVLCIQVATHFFNDALDFLKGADNFLRKGPKRAVQQKIISPSQLLKAGFVCLFLAAVAGSYLVFKGGVPILVIGLISLALAYLYTGGPYPLAYTGLADFFVLLFFGVIPVSAVAYLNTGQWDKETLILGFQCGLLALNLFLVNNLRDEESDRQAKKKTLVVRFGRGFGMFEWSLTHYLPYLLGLYWFFKSASHKEYFLMFLLPLFLLPLSFYIHRLLYKAFNKENLYSPVFSLTGMYYLSFVCILSFGLLF